MDPLQKVTPGDPLRIAAETFNCFIDAAKDFKARTMGMGRRGPVGAGPNSLVLVKNVSGADVNRYGVLIVTDILFSSGSNLDAFKNHLVVKGVAGNSQTDVNAPFVIVQEPLADGAIGRGRLVGASQVQVDITDTDHKLACLSPGQTDHLVSAEKGRAEILWKATGSTGTQWCVVLFGPPPDKVRVGVIVDPDSPGDERTDERYWFQFATVGNAAVNNQITLTESGTKYTASNFAEMLDHTHDLATGQQIAVFTVTDTSGVDHYFFWLTPPAKESFWGRITGRSEYSTGTNRWSYTFEEIEKTAAGYGGWTAVDGGRTGTAYNTVEDGNTAKGSPPNPPNVQGNGVDIDGPDFPEHFDIQPIALRPRRMWSETFTPSGGSETTEYWFEGDNGIDGTCD